MFEQFTQVERRKYLKFVWGRSKLPADTSDLNDNHSIQVMERRAVDALPEAHTCFFSIDIPVLSDIVRPAAVAACKSLRHHILETTVLSRGRYIQ